MNTHDKYELPPLPEPDQYTWYSRNLVESIRKAAVEADRQRSLLWGYCPECGNTEYTSHVGCGNFCTNCGQEWHSDIDYSEVVQKNLSGRQRRGEPVAWMTEDGRGRADGWAAGWDEAHGQPVAQTEPCTNTYVQTVPDQCDRIVWRGRYYHLHDGTGPVAQEPMALLALAARIESADGEPIPVSVEAASLIRGMLSRYGQPAQPAASAEPVYQFRKEHCADWYDGLPDHSDGGGPYEVRTLYSAPVAAHPDHSEQDLNMVAQTTGYEEFGKEAK